MSIVTRATLAESGLLRSLLFLSLVTLPFGAFDTPVWRYRAAAIVTGEAPAGCVECYELTACQIIRDATAGNPWGVVTAGPGRRWHGSRTPGEEHLQAVDRMLDSGCDAYPPCRFLGNEGDLRYWRRAYPELVTEIAGYCNENGCSMCIVEEPELAFECPVCIARGFMIQ